MQEATASILAGLHKRSALQGRLQCPLDWCQLFDSFRQSNLYDLHILRIRESSNLLTENYATLPVSSTSLEPSRSISISLADYSRNSHN